MRSHNCSGMITRHQWYWVPRCAALVMVLLLYSASALAADFRGVTYHNCHDGDSCTFTIPKVHPLLGKRINVEVANIDTPERNGACARETRLAKQARDVLRKMLREANQIDLINARRGHEFHLKATVLADGKDVAEIMISRNIAVRHHRGQSPADWCFKRRSFGLDIPYTPY